MDEAPKSITEVLDECLIGLFGPNADGGVKVQRSAEQKCSAGLG